MLLPLPISSPDLPILHCNTPHHTVIHCLYILQQFLTCYVVCILIAFLLFRSIDRSVCHSLGTSSYPPPITAFHSTFPPLLLSPVMSSVEEAWEALKRQDEEALRSFEALKNVRKLMKNR